MRKMNKSSGKRGSSGCCLGCFGKLLLWLLILGFILFFCFQGNLQKRFFQVLYPIRYEAEVTTFSNNYQVDPNLVYAIIRTESHFDPYAVSSANARGLMQLQEETAYDCAKALKMDDFTPDALFDPETNIHLGCYYINMLMKEFDGNINHVLAAYNGGIGNVKKWLKNESYVDNTQELVHIPFQETKDYVSKVMHAYEMYQNLYIDAE